MSFLKEKEALLAKATRFWITQKDRGVKIIAYGEEGYPHRLATLYAPPSLLYCRGDSELNVKHVVSIVGTRYPTSYGREVTKELVRQLKPYDALIVSGLAYGIDITAHQEALNQKMRTVAVLPAGLDMIYPSDHVEAVQAITKARGAIISEHGVGNRAMQHHFPARNRIIAGLADVTIVVEAPRKSGALITAYYANDFNREVFAVPGSIHAIHSEGCHALIKKQMAHLLTDIDDLAYVMNWSGATATVPAHDVITSISLTPLEKKVVTLIANLPKQVATMDKLQMHLNMPIKEITAVTLNLELKGVLHVTGSGYVFNS